MEEIQEKLKDLKDKFKKISAAINQDKLREEISRLETQTLREGFWNDRQRAETISRELSDLQKQLEALGNLEKRINQAIELLGDQAMQDELRNETKDIENTLKEFELKTFLSEPHDKSEAILSIHSGTGGVEAMDWVAMLSRMYQRYFERMNWRYEVTDESPGEEAGFKTVSMIIHKPLAYGYLKGEKGTHRLVRQSPFNADKLRQTSFALVEVLPVIDSQEVEINEDDIEFESFRSGGKGGQNVNKVSTAVRVRHKPSGMIVTAQTERSQLQNRENAMKLLLSKLWEKQQEEKEQLTKQLKGTTTQASWGTQIRSYILHPYHMVKDLRTEVETSDTDAVLDGDINQFIEAELRGLAPNESEG